MDYTLSDVALAELDAYLEGVTKLRAVCLQREPAPLYLGLEDLVRREGTAFREGTAKPAQMWPGVPRCCFYNAALMATALPERFTYVEGFAHCGFLPVHHAWLVDGLGRVVDWTWPEETNTVRAYRGLAFVPEEVNRLVLTKHRSVSGCVLDNPEEGHPLLTGKRALTDVLALNALAGAPHFALLAGG